MRLLLLHGCNTANVFLMSCHLLMQIAGRRCQGHWGLQSRVPLHLACVFRQSCWSLELALFFILSSCCVGSVSVTVCVGDLTKIAWHEGTSGS